jgi:hypothetical protein
MRLPTRGALGNGLRVVAGAVFASGGSLRVITNGRTLDLTPQESGETLVKVTPCTRREGTRIEVRLGPAIPKDPDFLDWARDAIRAAGEKPISCNKARRRSPATAETAPTTATNAGGCRLQSASASSRNRARSPAERRPGVRGESFRVPRELLRLVQRQALILG